MRHFIFFIFLIFGFLSALYLQKEDDVRNSEEKKIYVYASSSFVAKWGPGPALKELFERQNLFKIEYVESQDVNMTLQKLSFEAENSLADVVLGLDQFDISRSAGKIRWRDIDRTNSISYTSEIRAIANEAAFIPYDWAPLTFVTRKNFDKPVTSLKDVLVPELASKIALQDPRTSSPGLQFLVWIFENYDAEQAVKFLKSLNSQVYAYSNSWSASYGLFKSQQADLVFSYVTSPIYHLVEEKDDNFTAIETAEALPVQVEFAAIPVTCKNCEAAEMFVNFLLTEEAQKILMSKNYMLPVNGKVKEGTPFDALKVYKTLPVKFIEQSKLEKWINTWSEIRKNDNR